MLECLVAAEDITYGAMLNGGEEYPGPRAGMLIHEIGGEWFTVQSVGAPDLWQRLLTAMKRPELAQDPRFATPLARRRNWPELRPIITAWIDSFASAKDALAACNAARIPAAPVLSPADVIAHPHLAEREFFPAVPHPGRERVRVTGVPFMADGRRPLPAGPAPYRPGARPGYFTLENVAASSALPSLRGTTNPKPSRACGTSPRRKPSETVADPA